MSTIYYLLSLLFAFLCVFMVLLILIQKGRGGGLSGAFGGAGGNTAFGTKTGDLLTWVTASVFVLFILLAMGLTWTSDSINATNMATTPANLPGDDTATPADGEPVLPGGVNSSLPGAPASPEPGIVPSADGSSGDNTATPVE